MDSRQYYGSMLLYSYAKFVEVHGHSHLQEDISTTRLDTLGTLIIRIYRTIPHDAKPVLFLRADGFETRGIIVAQFQVSAEVMTQNSAIFEAVYHRNQWKTAYPAFIDLEYSDVMPVEIFLRGLHECFISHDALTRTKVEQVRDLLNIFRCPKQKFRHWFIEWFASRDLRHIILDNSASRESLRALCCHFNHPFALMFIDANIELNKVPKAISGYPPILVPSLRQLSEAIVLHRRAKPYAYASLSFSESFIQVYGKPMEFYSDFYELMTTEDITRLIPKFKDFSSTSTPWGRLLSLQFLEFAKAVDNKVKRNDWTETTVWRLKMEGAWVQMAVRLFESEMLRLGNFFTSNPLQREVLQCQLKKVISKRLHPSTRVEAYWEEKGAGESRELWEKKTVREKEITEMKNMKPESREQTDAMDALFMKMEELQLAAVNAPDPEEMTVEAAMNEAVKRIQDGDFRG